ncbi:hypothetical protein TK90_2801 (plasmid) [Thioalkalivibrio sp. K90mix]|uniref:AcaB family transcriptional regulator n=1 Tax=Thioalkalivibrio sp. (strain K90mix) TaxID=396595 RepID=UPI000195A71F|nr:AcaB family transcriptional regulator [Thioalkalivibrio sp. K90mix]ADC73286.1 hypothetical protein TK90_2801 [Thioalkalivibrio sp. K90mix]
MPDDYDVSSVDSPMGRLSLHRMYEFEAYTHTGRMLVNGRNAERNEDGRIVRHAIIGLTMFESKMRDVWADVSRSNPFAFYWLQKARASLEEIHNTVGDALDRTEEQLKDQGFDLENFPRPDPHETFELKIKTGIGWDAADLVRDVDLLESAMLFLRSAGEISNDTFQVEYKRFRKLARKALRSCMRYHHFPVNLDDYHAQTDTTKEAIQRLGDVPARILELDPSSAWFGPVIVDEDGKALPTESAA